MEDKPALFLASQSPRRRELLTQIGVPYKVVRVDVPEQRRSDEAAADYVQRLAQTKAEAGYAVVNKAVVLGADTIVVLDDLVLEKPATEDEAVAMLLSLSGRSHWVYSAVCLCSGTRLETALSKTEVLFREISEAEAHRYWLTSEPQDKAGSYAIQGLGAIFVLSLKGSYSGVVGLPLEVTYPLLKAFNVLHWQHNDQENSDSHL